LNPKEHMINSEILANIPECLRTPPLWVRFDLKRDPKKPDRKPSPRPVMKWADPEDRKANLRSLDYLIENARPCAGFQRFIDKDEGFVFIDLDGVRNPDTGELKTWAVEVIETLNSYTEVSKSGKGIHIVCRGTLDEDCSRPPIEIYSGNAKKLMAMTGELYDLLKMTIENRQAEVEQLLYRPSTLSQSVTRKMTSAKSCRNCAREIFCEQLAGWFTDERTWPADRSFDVFSRWFDHQHHSVLIDLCDELLIDESDRYGRVCSSA
jgi:primase-polymerase (primpol)-like protein